MKFADMLMKIKILLPFAFSLAIILGPAYTMYVHYDFSHSSDTKSYIKMSQGDYNVNSVHRYRFIIPFSAKTIATPIKLVYTKLWPHRADSLWPLQLAYFIINSILVAIYGTILYKLLRQYSNHYMSVFIALTVVLTSRWVAYIAGLPLTDSLYLIFIALLLYSIKTKNNYLFMFTVLLGGIMKESFLLFAPFILLTGPFNWYLRGLLIVLSCVFVFGEHWIIDKILPLNESIIAKKETLIDIFIRTSSRTLDTALDLISIRGVGEIFTVLGAFTFILIYGLLNHECRNVWKIQIEKYYWYFFGCILIHVLISGDAARMFYFGSALYAILLLKAVEIITNKYLNRL